jgi:hypothetical protein
MIILSDFLVDLFVCHCQHCLLPCLLQDDGSPVSIFSLSGSNPQDRHMVAGRNGVKRLRTVS